jgi:hypothetical protein
VNEAELIVQGLDPTVTEASVYSVPKLVPVMVKSEPPLVDAVEGFTPVIAGAIYENVSVLLSTEETLTAIK